VFFNAGCNEQVFCPKSCKKLMQIRLIVFETNAKTTHFISEKMTSLILRLGYS